MIEKVIMIGNSDSPVIRMDGYKAAVIRIKGLRDGRLHVHDKVILSDGDYEVDTDKPLAIKCYTSSQVIVRLKAEAA